jgi:hypothetical protein
VSVDAVWVWRRYFDHLGVLYATAGDRRTLTGRTWLLALTGERYPDLNQGVVLPGATVGDAAELARAIEESGLPVVIAVAPGTAEEVTAPLAAAGLMPVPSTEPLMWCASPPRAQSGRFDVRRAESHDDWRRAVALSSSGKAADAGLLDRALPPHGADAAPAAAWIAFLEREAVAVGWFTAHADVIGVWHMATPTAHRRRGAARAVLTVGLERTWRTTTRGALLWASPAGRSVYAAAGFETAQEVAVWYSGGWDAGAAAIGQAIS